MIAARKTSSSELSGLAAMRAFPYDQHSHGSYVKLYKEPPMGGVAKPKPSVFDGCRRVGIEAGRQVYKNEENNIYYTWDSMHGEVEVFDKNGRHLGAACPISGVLLKPAVRGRRIKKPN